MTIRVMFASIRLQNQITSSTTAIGTKTITTTKKTTGDTTAGEHCGTVVL